MRRWNGWGEETTVVELPENGRGFLAELIGPGLSLPDATLEQVLAKVPASRLPEHPLVVRDAHDRLLHARGLTEGGAGKQQAGGRCQTGPTDQRGG